MHSTQCTIYKAQYTLHNTQCTVYNAQYTMHNDNAQSGKPPQAPGMPTDLITNGFFVFGFLLFFPPDINSLLFFLGLIRHGVQ